MGDRNPRGRVVYLTAPDATGNLRTKKGTVVSIGGSHADS
jgi:hypothetical protein